MTFKTYQTFAIATLEKQNKKLKEALQYYADCEDMQEVNTSDGGRTWSVDDGYGDLAHETLEEVSKM